jgi:hypothetical protein
VNGYGAFISECCITGVGGLRAKGSVLLERYREWSGEQSVTQRRFGLAMTERGFRRITNNGTYYEGIGLRHDEGDS